MLVNISPGFLYLPLFLSSYSQKKDKKFQKADTSMLSFQAKVTKEKVAHLCAYHLPSIHKTLLNMFLKPKFLKLYKGATKIHR